jgi:hypothetical protein
MSYQLSAISYQLSAVSCQPSALDRGTVIPPQCRSSCGCSWRVCPAGRPTTGGSALRISRGRRVGGCTVYPIRRASAPSAGRTQAHLGPEGRVRGPAENGRPAGHARGRPCTGTLTIPILNGAPKPRAPEPSAPELFNVRPIRPWISGSCAMRIAPARSPRRRSRRTPRS